MVLRATYRSARVELSPPPCFPFSLFTCCLVSLLPRAGGGNRLLMGGALETTDEALLDKAVALKVAADAASDHAASIPFPGIPALLAALAAGGGGGDEDARHPPPPALAILSNKSEPFVVSLTARLFPSTPFRVVAGATDTRPLKPDAGALAAVCAELGVVPRDAVLVGDTEVDMAAAAAAGATAVGVAWGFRGGEALRAGGGGIVVDTVDELKAVLQAGVPPLGGLAAAAAVRDTVRV